MGQIRQYKKGETFTNCLPVIESPMDLSRSGFGEFEEFFSRNEEGAKARYKNLHGNFRSVFKEIINIGCSTNFKSAQKGASVILFLRATKYLFAAHKLAIQGHSEEARILLRNIIELIMIAYLISKSDEVYALWKECFELRKKHTDENGVVDIKEFKDRKYKVREIIKNHRDLLKVNPATKHLERVRGEFSEYFSHENLFNIVPRVEFGEKESTVYIGDSFESNNARMTKNIQLTADIAEDILELVKKLVPKARA